MYLLNANWVLFSAQIQTTFEEVENRTALNTFEQLFSKTKHFKKNVKGIYVVSISTLH